MSGSAQGDIKAEPDMTPLLDVVFQLIAFFMLVFQISGDNYDQRIKLPVAGSARPMEGDRPVEDRITLNIDSEGRLSWENELLDPERARRKIVEQAKLARLNLKISGKDVKAGESLPTIIVLRVDRGARFSEVYRYITACQSNGFTRFDLKAMNSEG